MNSWGSARAEFAVATAQQDFGRQILALHHMGKYVLGNFPANEQLERIAIYDVARSSTWSVGVDLTPDWRSVFNARQEEGNSFRSITRFSLLMSPLQNGAAELYHKSGVPLHRHLYFQPADLEASPLGIMASWKSVLNVLENDPWPGHWKGILVTDRDLTGDQVFECSYDGDNVFGTAARGWLPMELIHRETSSVFFSRNSWQWEQTLTFYEHLARSQKVKFISLMLGHRDLGELINLPPSGIARRIANMLISLQERTGVKVIFGGIPALGPAEYQLLARAVHLRLFARVDELRSKQVIFFDCCHPSPSVDFRLVYRGDDAHTMQFKAVALFNLSRVTAMSFDCMWAPTDLYPAGDHQKQFYRFCSRRRGMLE